MGKVTILNHPIVKERLTCIRKKDTDNKTFYDNLKLVSQVLCIEATKDINTKNIEIETPICKTVQPVIDENIVIVPILRAGLGMVDPIRDLLPKAKVGILGMYRDETTLKPVEYYAKFPEHMEDALVLVVDPMLATGGSACDAISQVKKRGAKNIKFLAIVSAQVGIDNVVKNHPDVDVYAAALDDHLNEKGYIVPGLGDCGDRLFGTD